MEFSEDDEDEEEEDGGGDENGDDDEEEVSKKTTDQLTVDYSWRSLTKFPSLKRIDWIDYSPTVKRFWQPPLWGSLIKIRKSTKINQPW